MNTYPKYETYAKLYGRYLKKGVEPFFARMDPKDKNILDLCAGGGQLSEYAINLGAKRVVQVDKSYEMINTQIKGFDRILRATEPVEKFLKEYGEYWWEEPPFDLVVCRQGTNYWFKKVDGCDIAKVLNTGGMFVFNTFGNKPTETPMVREYYHGGIKYKEVSFLFDGRVHHVQTAEGLEPHFTVFDWISREEYIEKLSPYFLLDEVVDGPSSMWYCTKK